MTDAEPQRAPSLAIRSKPPSPKRLSRKVLLGGALAAGLIVAVALINGLSDDGHSEHRASAEVQAAAGPPQSITGAASSYDAAALGFGGETELLPPEDPFWAGAPQPAGSGEAVSAGSAPNRAADPEAEARSSEILFTRAASSPNADRDNAGELPSRLLAPRSAYLVQAGAVIPAALVTGLNSDLPGMVIAQVTAPVYDSVSGRHLLIPQGARLIGVYRDGPAYGESRVFLSWTRLILPNGWSIDLQEMQASDPSGASGVRDRTDQHLGRLGIAIGLSAVISVIANESEDEGQDGRALSRSVGDAAAQQAAQTGARVIDRELNVRPTIVIRPGSPVRVLVSRDILLRPYRQ